MWDAPQLPAGFVAYVVQRVRPNPSLAAAVCFPDLEARLIDVPCSSAQHARLGSRSKRAPLNLWSLVPFASPLQ